MFFSLMAAITPPQGQPTPNNILIQHPMGGPKPGHPAPESRESCRLPPPAAARRTHTRRSHRAHLRKGDGSRLIETAVVGSTTAAVPFLAMSTKQAAINTEHDECANYSAWVGTIRCESTREESAEFFSRKKSQGSYRTR